MTRVPHERMDPKESTQIRQPRFGLVADRPDRDWSFGSVAEGAWGSTPTLINPVWGNASTVETQG